MTVNDPGALVARILERPDRQLLPWPEASQDLALLAFMIDGQRGWLRKTEAVAQVEAFISDTAKRGASWSAEELVEHLALNGVLPNEYPSEHG